MSFTEVGATRCRCRCLVHLSIADSLSHTRTHTRAQIKLPADQVLSLHAEKAIKEHVHQPEALREAADPATEETPEQVIYKAALSGIVAVVAAMKASPDDAPTQWHGCDAVASLTAGKPDNRAACKEEGGLDAVVAALKRFPDNVTVQLKGAWAVANLAADYAAELGELGAVDAVVALMRVDDYQLKSVGVRSRRVAARRLWLVRVRVRGLPLGVPRRAGARVVQPVHHGAQHRPCREAWRRGCGGGDPRVPW